MTLQKMIAVIAAVTSLALFGNLVMFQSPKLSISAQTTTSSTTTASSENDIKTEQSSEKEAETSKSIEESKTAESTAPSTEQAKASEADTPRETTDTTQATEVKQAEATPAPVTEEAAPATEPIEETIVETQPPAAEAVPAAEPAAQLQPNMLQIAGSYIPYSNAGQGSGQAVIDADHGAAATWGGASVQSGNDGMNTHIIGHNPGAFNVLFSLGVGSTIEVSDASGQISTYTVQNIVTVDDSAYGLDGTDYWNQITGTGGGERLTLQTCINDFQNLIVFAA
ncbi:class F sortase [Enterococcus pallens]|uniref:Sortase n=1 Tax=Enterococcus pallens ATCC BAA-351 TaxID=1158607 RepID=R2QD47_9ENTE|nr:class F sortase [Enterococcus pallens]EOH94337.1 hypothetical protein UAU_02072 [Enterococcus pallens ATCC BAA-351]EOU24216.1 hypothetical protein I588_00203 [Enterococcus pallens ATCC BAA-351]OJG82006.1 hypothetical protein RV10_GL001870 [Enterococcus pallens]